MKIHAPHNNYIISGFLMWAKVTVMPRKEGGETAGEH